MRESTSRRNLLLALTGLATAAAAAPAVQALPAPARPYVDPIHELIAQHRNIWASIGAMMTARDECHEDDGRHTAYACAVDVAYDRARRLVAAMAQAGATTVAGWAALLSYQSEVTDLEHTFIDQSRTATFGEVIERKFRQAQVELPGLADERLRERALDEFTREAIERAIAAARD